MTVPHGSNSAKSTVLPGRNIVPGQPENHLKTKNNNILAFSMFVPLGIYFTYAYNKN